MLVLIVRQISQRSEQCAENSYSPTDWGSTILLTFEPYALSCVCLLMKYVDDSLVSSSYIQENKLSFLVCGFNVVY